MRILDFFRGKPKPQPPSDRVRELLDRFLDDLTNFPIDWRTTAADLPSCRAILDATPAEQATLMLLLIEESKPFVANPNRYWTKGIVSGFISQMLRRKLPFTEADLMWIADRVKDRYSSFPNAPVVGTIESYVAEHGLSDVLREAVTAMYKRLTPYAHSTEDRRVMTRLEILLARTTDGPIFAAASDEWTVAAKTEIHAMPPAQQAVWRELISLARLAPSKPSKKWLKEMGTRIERIGAEAFRDAMRRWLPLFDQPKDRDLPDAPNVDAFRGLVFCTILVADRSIPPLLGDAAERSFRKVPGIGAVSAKAGNACVVALSEIGSPEATAQLGRLRSRVKLRSAAKVIERAFEEAAKRAGVTPEDLEESTVPTFGMTEPGILRRVIGDATGEVSMDDFSISWVLASGKRQSSVPAAIRQLPEVKELKKTVAELQTMLAAQRERLDGLYLAPRSWSAADWRERYLDHPLTGILARRLIWTLTHDDGTRSTALWVDGALRDENGADARDAVTIALWHPIEGDTDLVLAWRRRLESLQITQPFKQAHREIYVITDAELGTGTYSNRFAAHILRQHQFAALCRDRRWRYSLQGAFDAPEITPTRELPAWNLRAQFWVDGVGGAEQTDMTEAGIFLYVATDQVRFLDAQNAAVPLADVPPLVFSEVMRHVDLFVGVASIGNDPNWNDQGGVRHNAYWQSYAFGELSGSAATRRAILQSLVPRLRIAPRCSVEERFLIVRGDLRTYKIHLGTSNILMEPNDQYLCIVADRGPAEKLYVPFEGDTMLTLILSKAFLLADDRKITDPTITRQLARR